MHATLHKVCPQCAAKAEQGNAMPRNVQNQPRATDTSEVSKDALARPVNMEFNNLAGPRSDSSSQYESNTSTASVTGRLKNALCS